MNTHSETFTPLVCNVVDDALLKATPATDLGVGAIGLMK